VTRDAGDMAVPYRAPRKVACVMTIILVSASLNGDFSSSVYRVSQERSIFSEVIVSAILIKKLYMYMCPIPNGFRDRAISLYSSKIVDKQSKRYYVSKVVPVLN
jgi:hypothetical protein